MPPTPQIRASHGQDGRVILAVDRRAALADQIPESTFCSSLAPRIDAPHQIAERLPRARPFPDHINHHYPLHVDYVFVNLDPELQGALVVPGMANAAGYANIAQFFHDLSCRVLRKLYSQYFDLIDAGLAPTEMPGDVSRPPNKKTICCFADPEEGVAWTYGPGHDHLTTSHIHFSTGFLKDMLRHFNGSHALLSTDFPGVIVHEMTHAWQYDGGTNRGGHATMPGCMIEGIADWLRTNLGYAPDHWHLPEAAHVRATKWTDESNTQFLCWIDRRFPGFVEEVNRVCAFEEFWKDAGGRTRDLAKQVCGKTFEELWKMWGDWLEMVEAEGRGRDRTWRRIFMD